MALTKGINAYITVAEASAYIDDKLDAAAWSDATLAEQAQAVITATRLLDDLRWIGTAIIDSQLLAFPRDGSYFEPRLGKIIYLPVYVPPRIEQACAELAYHLLNNDGILDDTGVVRSISIDTINLTNMISANALPSVVKKIINPLRINQGSLLPWRAN